MKTIKKLTITLTLAAGLMTTAQAIEPKVQSPLTAYHFDNLQKAHKLIETAIENNTDVTEEPLKLLNPLSNFLAGTLLISYLNLAIQALNTPKTTESRRSYHLNSARISLTKIITPLSGMPPRRTDA